MGGASSLDSRAGAGCGVGGVGWWGEGLFSAKSGSVVKASSTQAGFVPSTGSLMPPRASMGCCGSVDHTLSSKVLEASGLNGDGDEGSQAGVGGGELGWI